MGNGAEEDEDGKKLNSISKGKVFSFVKYKGQKARDKKVAKGDDNV